MMFLICFIVALCHLVIAENVTQCCEPDRVLLKGKVTCWEPNTKSMVKVNIACNDTVKMPANYSINDDNSITIKYLLENQQEFDVNVEFGRYCIGRQTTMKDVNLTYLTIAVVLCVDEEKEVVENHVKAYCMIVSVVFLILTALIYALIPELRDLLGKSIINFCISSAIGLMIIIIMTIVEYSNMRLCAARGFLAYFFVIASFFWTNAISIQILLSMSRPYVHDKGWKEFKWYALYAWGSPALLTVCMAIVNYHPGKHEKPGIGLNHCWFLGNQQWYYMYSVMSILIVANISIFVWMLSRLWCHNFNSSHIRALRFKLMLSLRLFILMGVPWIFEMIGSVSGSHIVWTILDIFNTLQGLFIFILLVVLRKRALKLMYKHGWLCCLTRYVEKHLAIVDDDEDLAEHTVDVGLEENYKINGKRNVTIN